MALRVFAVGNMPVPNRSTRVPAARCPAPPGTRATFTYATHALADLTEVQVNLVCDVCTHDNGRSRRGSSATSTGARATPRSSGGEEGSPSSFAPNR